MKNFTYILQTFAVALLVLNAPIMQGMEKDSLVTSKTLTSKEENLILIKCFRYFTIPNEIKERIISLTATLISLDYAVSSPMSLELEESIIHPAAFSTEGHIIVIGLDTIARLWNTKTGDELRILIKYHTGTISSVAWSPAETTFLTGSFDKTARLWDSTTGECIGVLRGHDSQLISVAFSSDGKTILTQSKDGVICLWDTTNLIGPSVSLIGNYESPISTVAFSGSKPWIVTGSDKGNLCLWDSNTGELLKQFKKEHTERITSLSCASEGEIILTGSEDSKACLWQSDSVTIFQHQDSVLLALYNPTGTSVLTILNKSKVAQLWNTATKEKLFQLVGHKGSIKSAAFSPDGKTILTGSSDKTARLWDSATGTLLRTLKEHIDKITSVMFGPDGKTMLIISSKGNIAYLWIPSREEIIEERKTLLSRLLGCNLTDSPLLQETTNIKTNEPKLLISYKETSPNSHLEEREEQKIELSDSSSDKEQSSTSSQDTACENCVLQ